MRNGEIVKEGSPQDIMSDYNTDSLESAFLVICCNQGTNEVLLYFKILISILFLFIQFCVV